MHEMSYVVRIVNIAIETAMEHNASRVETVCVEVGEMTGIDPVYLHKYYGTAIQGTVLEGSKLEVVPVPVAAVCEECGQGYHPDREHDYLCPTCHGGRCHITQGRDMVVREVCMETASDT